MAEMHSPLLCAKQASAVMKGVGGSVVFISNAGERALTEGSGNVGAISALTSSAAAAGGPVGIRVNCVTHALGGDEDDESHNSSSGGHGSFSLATMRGPSAEDVAMQARTAEGSTFGRPRGKKSFPPYIICVQYGTRPQFTSYLFLDHEMDCKCFFSRGTMTTGLPVSQLLAG